MAAGEVTITLRLEVEGAPDESIQFTISREGVQLIWGDDPLTRIRSTIRDDVRLKALPEVTAGAVDKWIEDNVEIS